MPGIGFSMPHGVHPRDTIANDYPGATRMNTYVSSLAANLGTETRQPQWLIKLFNDLGSAAVVGRPYVISFDGADLDQIPKAITPATIAADQYVVVAVEAVADQAWGWYCCAGWVDALVDGGTNDVTAGDYLKVANAGTSFVDDGTARTTDTCAKASTTNTGAAAMQKILLLGDRADID